MRQVESSGGPEVNNDTFTRKAVRSRGDGDSDGDEQNNDVADGSTNPKWTVELYDTKEGIYAAALSHSLAADAIKHLEWLIETLRRRPSNAQSKAARYSPLFLFGVVAL